MVYGYSLETEAGYVIDIESLTTYYTAVGAPNKLSIVTRYITVLETRRRLLGRKFSGKGVLTLPSILITIQVAS